MHRLHRTAILIFCTGSLLLVHLPSEAQATEAALVAPPDASPATPDPETPRAHSSGEAPSLSPETQGDMLMMHGNYAAAIRVYEQVTPRTAAIWNKTGMAYHHLFAVDQAMKDYEMAIRLDPQYAQAYNNLGAIYQGKQQFGLAEKAYKNAIRYQPRLAVSYCNLGTTYFAELKSRLGVESYRKALELDPEVFSPKRLNKIDEGSPRGQRVLAAYSLAKVYASAGRNQEAMESLHTALAAGFRDRKHLLRDKEFAALRETPEFRQLLAEEHLE